METRQQSMIRTLHEAGYTYSAIASYVGVSEPALRRWIVGGGCRDPKTFARLRELYVKVCDELRFKHD